MHIVFYSTSHVFEAEERLKEKGIDLANVDTKGLSEKIGDFFGNIFTAIANFFSGLFG